MSRIFWDAMMFIYLLEGHPRFSPFVRHVLQRSYERGDVLLTSCLALGEVMVGGKENPDPQSLKLAATTLSEMGFSFLPFDQNCPPIFATLRSESKLRVADAAHLACASAAGVDMYMTGDAQLLKRGLHVPGIQFIADFTLPIL